MTCPKCGQILPDHASSCNFCGETNLNATPTQNTTPTPVAKEENVVRGFVGALIGALIGGAAIYLLYYLGYVAALGGLVLAFCSLKGYELLGGKLSIKGIVISLVFILVIPLVAYVLYIISSVVRDVPGYTLGSAFNLFIEQLPINSELRGDVISDVLMLYGFTALGAAGLIVNAFKNR